MTDPILVERIAKRLAEASEATAQGAGFWEALAQIAATEAAIPTVPLITKPLPALPLLALGQRREGFTVLVTGATALDLMGQVQALYDAGLSQDAWLVEVKRIVGRA